MLRNSFRRHLPRRALSLTDPLRVPLMFSSCTRLDAPASPAPVPLVPGLSNHHQVHPFITTLEPLSPFKVDGVLNWSDDDAISSFMDPFFSPPGWEGPPSCAAPVVDRCPVADTKVGNARRRRRREPDPFVSTPGLEAPSGPHHVAPTKDHSLASKVQKVRRRRPRPPAKSGDVSTFTKRITSNTYLRRLYLTRQQAVALAPTMARVVEMHDHTKDPATTVSARVAVLDEHDVAHELECKCYLSSREHHFVLCAGWSTLRTQSGVVLGDAVVFSRVGQGRFRVVRVKGGV